MRWTVDLRPYDGLAWAVQGFTSGVLRTITANLPAHLADPGATVELQGPRGSGPSFGQVRTDSWVGAVLKAHRADSRSPVEQSVALLKPWAWAPPPKLLEEEWTEQPWS